MRERILRLVILLAILTWPAACGAKPEPTMLEIATEAEPTVALTEAASNPTATAIIPTTRPSAFSQERLIEDARQLAEIIENAHPDPYIRGGGKIAFHRRLQRILEAIPTEGMTRDEFIRLLRPFIGAIGDSHRDILWGPSLQRTISGTSAVYHKEGADPWKRHAHHGRCVYQRR